LSIAANAADTSGIIGNRDGGPFPRQALAFYRCVRHNTDMSTAVGSATASIVAATSTNASAAISLLNSTSNSEKVDTGILLASLGIGGKFSGAG
jgi:hypothetical protein